MSDVSPNGYISHVINPNNYTKAGDYQTATTRSSNANLETNHNRMVTTANNGMEILESRFDSLQLNGHGHINGGHPPNTSPSVSMSSASPVYLPSTTAQVNGASLGSGAVSVGGGGTIAAAVPHISLANGTSGTAAVSSVGSGSTSQLQNSQHRSSSSRTSCSQIAAPGASNSTTSAAAAIVVAAGHQTSNNLYHQDVLSQQYLSANAAASAHNLVHSSDYGLKFNSFSSSSSPSPNGSKSFSSPKKQQPPQHINGYNSSSSLIATPTGNGSPASSRQQHHVMNGYHISAAASAQQHQARASGDHSSHSQGAINPAAQMSAVAAAAAVAAAQMTRRPASMNNLSLHSSRESASPPTMHRSNSTTPAVVQHLSNKQSGFHRLHHKERPPLLQHCNSGDANRDTVLNQFRDVLHMLTWQPDAFDDVVPFLVGALNCGKVHTDASITLANLLVSWSIAEENFRFTGAKLSHYLCLPEQLSFAFKAHFFKSVRSEVDRMDQLIKEQSQSNHQKLEGVLLFICELYLNMGEVELDSFGGMTVSRIEFLRNVLKDALLKILELSPFDKPFLIVGKALKLTGAALDESDSCDTESFKQSSRSKTDRIYRHIEAIQQDDNTSDKVKELYKRVLELRKAKWISEGLSLPRGDIMQRGGCAAAQMHPGHHHQHHQRQQQQQMQSQLQQQHQAYLNYENHAAAAANSKKGMKHLRFDNSAGVSAESSSFLHAHITNQANAAVAAAAAAHFGMRNGGMSTPPEMFLTGPGGATSSGASQQQQQSHIAGVNNIGANNSSSSIVSSGSGSSSGAVGSSLHSLGGSGATGAAPTSSYSSVAAAMYQQNAATIANVTAEMPLDPVFFLSDGTAIPAHEAEYEMVNCDFESYSAAAAAADFYAHRSDLTGDASGGDNAHSAADCIFMPESSVLSGYNETLAAFESVNNTIDLMNGGGDIVPRVHTLNDEEDAAFSMFLEENNQHQAGGPPSFGGVPPHPSMPPPRM